MKKILQSKLLATVILTGATIGIGLVNSQTILTEETPSVTIDENRGGESTKSLDKSDYDKQFVDGEQVYTPEHVMANKELSGEISNSIEEAVDDVKGEFANYDWQVSVKGINDDVNVNMSSGNEGSLPSASTIKTFIALANEDVGKPASESDVKAMLSQSDNAATNRVIDVVGMDNINRYIKETGAFNTELNRKMLDNKSVKTNLTTAEDLTNMLAKNIEKPWLREYMTNTNTHNSKLLGDLPKGVTGINKFGENLGVSNDSAVITVNNKQYAIATLVSNPRGERTYIDANRVNNAFKVLGRRIAEAVLAVEAKSNRK